VVESGPRANGWFCEVDDVESLSETLHQAITDERERDRRGQNALALIREEYDWMGIARRYESVFEQMIR
jgi:glycosyltransferase involved in cell wall biosynthesis